MKVAIVDYDGTLFTKETIPFLLGLAKKKGVPTRDYYRTLARTYFILVRYKLSSKKHLIKERFHREVSAAFLSIYQNMSQEEIEKFFLEIVKEAEQYFNGALLKELEELKEKGYKLILLSGGFLPYVGLVAEKLGFDYVFATELDYAHKGFDLNKDLDFITGKRKKEIIEENFPEEMQVDWSASYAYADSYFDSDVLEMTGNPTAVNPDERLRQMAQEKGWAIIEDS